MTPATARNPEPLWKLCLRFLTGGQINYLYPLDEPQVVYLLQDLYALGERPSVDELRAFARQIWSDWGSSEKRLVEIWKLISRNPDHRFRRLKGIEWRDQPFFKVEYIIKENGLTGLSERLGEVACTALHELVAASESGDRASYEAKREAVRRATNSVDRLRRLRFGSSFDQDRADGLSL